MYSGAVIDLVLEPGYDVLKEIMEYETKDRWVRRLDSERYYNMVKDLRP